MTFFDAFYSANLVVWAAVALFLIVRLRVFQAAPLVTAPPRQSTLSLPVVGGVIVAYLFIQFAVAVVALSMGVISQADLGIPKKLPTEVPATTQAATALATTDTVPSSLATAPASKPAAPMEKEDPAHAVTMSTIVTLSYLLTITPVALLLPLLFKERYRGWGLHLRQLPRGMLWGLLAFLIISPLLLFFEYGLTLLYDYFRHEISEHSTFEALDQSPTVIQQLILYGVAVIVAPLAEEFFFRGILQTTLIQYGWGLLMPQFARPGAIPPDYRPTAFHRWGAIVLTSLMFAAVHQADHAPIIFVLSLALGYVYERTGILWASIAMHMAFNGTQVLVYFLDSLQAK